MWQTDAGVSAQLRREGLLFAAGMVQAFAPLALPAMIAYGETAVSTVLGYGSSGAQLLG